MSLDWMPFDFHPSNKREALLALFKQGLDQKIDPLRLCELVRNIAHHARHDTRLSVELSQSLISYAPELVTAWSIHAQCLRLDNQKQQAKIAAYKGLKIDPENIDLLILLGKLFSENNSLEKAENMLRAAFKVNPGLSSLTLCEVLIRRNKLELAGEILHDQVVNFGHSTSSKALQTVLNQRSKTRSEENRLLQRQLVMESVLNEKLGNENIEKLNADLIDRLTSHPQLVREPNSTATTKGRQGFLNDLLSIELTETILKIIQAQVEEYVEFHANHEFLENMPERLSITAWAVLLDEGGFQQPHVHPAGWLSGVYYVDVTENSNGLDGALEFWKPTQSLLGNSKAETLVVQPKNGLMVLFPSYYYHHTIPHSGQSERISISFDIG